jgi:hypothetical protein
MIKKIDEFITEQIAKTIKISPHYSIWCSQISHPCLRFHEYNILRWSDALKHSPNRQELYDKGKQEEKIVLDKLRNLGFEILENQRPIFENIKIGNKKLRYGISGRIDTLLSHPILDEEIFGTVEEKLHKIPTEIKSCDTFTFESINSQEDIKNHKRWYVRGYIGQIMLYMYSYAVEDGLIIFSNKVTGKLKFIHIKLDYDYVEELMKKVEQVNSTIEKIGDRTEFEDLLDDRIEFDSKICGDCQYRHICLRDVQYGGEDIVFDDTLINDLERREILKSYKDEYEELDELIKTKFKSKGEGKYLVSDFDVIVKKVETSKYDIPKDIKEKYKKETLYLKVVIKKVK